MFAVFFAKVKEKLVSKIHTMSNFLLKFGGLFKFQNSRVVCFTADHLGKRLNILLKITHFVIITYNRIVYKFFAKVTVEEHSLRVP